MFIKGGLSFSEAFTGTLDERAGATIRGYLIVFFSWMFSGIFADLNVCIFGFLLPMFELPFPVFWVVVVFFLFASL